MRSARALAGDDGIEAALARLEPDVANELRDVLAVAWCRLSSLRTFHETAAAVLKEDPTAFHLRIVEHTARQMLHTTLRFFLRLTSPDALVRRASTMYARVFDTGSMEASVVTPGHSVARLVGWPSPPAFHLDGVSTGLVTLLKVAKIETVRARWTRTPEGADFDIRTSR
jgi:hypothetical protein